MICVLVRLFVQAKTHGLKIAQKHKKVLPLGFDLCPHFIYIRTIPDIEHP